MPDAAWKTRGPALWAGPARCAYLPLFFATLAARFSFTVLAGFFLVSFFLSMPLAMSESSWVRDHSRWELRPLPSRPPERGCDSELQRHENAVRILDVIRERRALPEAKSRVERSRGGEVFGRAGLQTESHIPSPA